jgi:hypothetical protein
MGQRTRRIDDKGQESDKVRYEETRSVSRPSAGLIAGDQREREKVIVML